MTLERTYTCEFESSDTSLTTFVTADWSCLEESCIEESYLVVYVSSLTRNSQNYSKIFPVNVEQHSTIISLK